MKRKILVLEDEENIRSFLVLNLKRSGYEAVSYTHLDVYKRQSPACGKPSRSGRKTTCGALRERDGSRARCA